ncbi:B12-binding domain-containing radical SAM protein [Paractinoplanes durhamensis]|uniref:Uncharacterized protein n=1 Tax=Paractinoplanes durhamensis TaxID=113563 RepID=A0ABQ3YZZ2_9ACTN|nr:radical SAM protein [Actinoplanes durhamensis]GIE03150.1 hypothetical protein Adu01nite_45000 [Actinoplanes durhamensis]
MAAGYGERNAEGTPIRMMAVSLYSERYPAIGENHGLSAIGGAVRASFSESALQLTLLDMVEWGEEDAERLASSIRQAEPHVLAIGLQYGTYSFLSKHYSRLRQAVTESNALIVFGGPLATYLSDRLLDEVEPESVVILGEADEALPLLLQAWKTGSKSWPQVPNIRYRDKISGLAISSRRKLVDLNRLSIPSRQHLKIIAELGGEIFVETSRGCSWAACTFCLRGLTDIHGRSHEFRRKSPELVAQDLQDLNTLGVTDITVADEDFLGGKLEETEKFVYRLLDQLRSPFRFDASATVHSVFSRRDSPEMATRRRALLQALVDSGLQKVFLGIESCSDTQLKRYAKGHTRTEAVQAAELLRSLGVRVEIGVILFDPLCSLAEIEDSLQFMRANDLASVASGISSELRLQTGSTYLHMLRKYEISSGNALHDRDFDPDTLTHSYRFRSPEVQSLHGIVQHWNRKLHPLYYPAKSLSRFGVHGALGSSVRSMRTATNTFRDETCDAIIYAIRRGRDGDDPRETLDYALTAAAYHLAHAVVKTLEHENMKDSHPVIRRVFTAARDIDELIAN